MAGQQFVDVLAMATLGTKGPTNAVRIAADAAGNLKASVKGGAFAAISAGGFGSDTIVQMLNNVPALVNALELVLAMPATAPGTEFATWLIRLIGSGVLTDIASFSWTGSNANPRFFLGDAPSARGLIRVGNSNLQITMGVLQLDISSNGSATWACRVIEGRGAGTISVNTLTLSVFGNLTTVPGTPTIQGIVTSGYTAGYSGRLELASGSTIVHNSGAPGAGAVAILTPTAANIVTASARVIPVSYNGTNWFVDG